MNLLVLIFLSTGAAAQSIGIQNNPAFLNQEMSMESQSSRLDESAHPGTKSSVA